MVVINHPCMNEDEFKDYCRLLDDKSKEDGRTNEHHVSTQNYRFPALVVTVVNTPLAPDPWGKLRPGKLREVCHTMLTKDRLMKVLGLTQTEIKVDFGMLKDEAIQEETIEQREI